MGLIKRRKFLILCVLIISIVVAFCVATGGKRYDIVLTNYETTEDGRVIVLDVSVASSMGYIRTLSMEEEGNSILLTFYSTYGMNNIYGAKDKFPIELPENCTEIYFSRYDGERELVLYKDVIDYAWSIPT